MDSPAANKDAFFSQQERDGHHHGETMSDFWVEPDAMKLCAKCLYTQIWTISSADDPTCREIITGGDAAAQTILEKLRELATRLPRD
jgi:ABC-type Zn2+ transport system substrate-binding protein/surface adhesin